MKLHLAGLASGMVLILSIPAFAEGGHFAITPTVPGLGGATGCGAQTRVCSNCSDPCCNLCLPQARMTQSEAAGFCEEFGGRLAGTNRLRNESTQLLGVTWSSRVNLYEVGLFIKRTRASAVAIDANGNTHTHKPNCRHYVACEFSRF